MGSADMDDLVVIESHFPSPSRSSVTSRAKHGSDSSPCFVPHRGSLRRIHSADPPRYSFSSSDFDEGTTEAPSASLSFFYAIPIVLGLSLTNGGIHNNNPRSDRQATHELKFERSEYEFISRLFSIIDTESRGVIGRGPIQEFVRLRCPVFRRRDNAIAEYAKTERHSAATSDDYIGSRTFDEVWDGVVWCSAEFAKYSTLISDSDVKLGIEAWMVFCRFIALAQYQEAKRRFSARHLQQTMRPKSGGRGSEVVLVNVPPPDPPAKLTAADLASYERQSKSPIALPELDLDHCLVSSHDTNSSKYSNAAVAGKVKIAVFCPGRSTALFSSSPSLQTSSNDRDAIEFILTYTSKAEEQPIIVRRTFSDLKWLNDTFTSHKSPGGTLCGRILPPFPKRAGSGSASYYDKSSHSSGVVVESGKAAIAAASASVGIIKSVAKSFWVGGTSSKKDNKASSSSGSSESKLAKLGKGIGSTLKKPRSNENSSDAISSKARQVERYVNYLLEHPALSTSFPLNTILKASRSGLDSAKRVLESGAHLDGQKQLENIAESDRGKPSTYLSSLLTASGLSPANQPNLAWVRTAAQAAMALKLHGILETTGMPSASAKLQHASLPCFKKPSPGDEDTGDTPRCDEVRKSVRKGIDDAGEDDESFENGVVSVESALRKEDDPYGDSDGYDMLPSPLPLKERSVLCAGSIKDDKIDASAAADMIAASFHHDKSESSTSAGEPRFHYGSRPIGKGYGVDEKATLLGDMSVDNDIDRLREIIGSVDNTLGRCLAASTLISEKRRKRDVINRNIVCGLDGWEGLRGEIVSQRALLEGLTLLEQGMKSAAKSCSASNDDLSWQSSLASAAVSAAEDVRCAVRAARTATGAKVAAEAAAETSRRVCVEGKFSSDNEERAAQTRASIAQSHAIHATVIEHEALAAKRRAAMALAYDVKCWNVHRKRELLHMCRAMASSQRQACRQSAEAWERLRDGLVDSSFVSIIDEKRTEHTTDGVGSEITQKLPPFKPVIFSAAERVDERSHPTVNADVESYEAPLLLFSESDGGISLSQSSVHNPANLDALISVTAAAYETPSAESLVSSMHDPLEAAEDEGHTLALPLPIESVPEESSQTQDDESVLAPQNILDSIDSSGPDSGSFGQHSQHAESERGIISGEHARVGNDMMTASMQSLVDGLMNWGGQYDSSQDLSLPSGMAVTIALEGSQMNTDQE